MGTDSSTFSRSSAWVCADSTFYVLASNAVAVLKAESMPLKSQYENVRDQSANAIKNIGVLTFVLVEAAGVEPASANSPSSDLHA